MGMASAVECQFVCHPPGRGLKMGLRCLPEGHLSMLSEAAYFGAEVANLAPMSTWLCREVSFRSQRRDPSVAAMRRNDASYQHIDPLLVGNQMRVSFRSSRTGNLVSK